MFGSKPIPKEVLQSLTAEIIEMSKIDQQVLNESSWETIKAIRVKNTDRLKEIILQIGWPTISKVGRHASQMAWLLVQHSDHDLDFQKECLKLMKSSRKGQVGSDNIAYLEDRIRVHEGRPQLYGTQFDDAVNFALNK